MDRVDVVQKPALFDLFSAGEMLKTINSSNASDLTDYLPSLLLQLRDSDAANNTHLGEKLMELSVTHKDADIVEDYLHVVQELGSKSIKDIITSEKFVESSKSSISNIENSGSDINVQNQASGVLAFEKANPAKRIYMLLSEIAELLRNLRQESIVSDLFRRKALAGEIRIILPIILEHFTELSVRKVTIVLLKEGGFSDLLIEAIVCNDPILLESVVNGIADAESEDDFQIEDTTLVERCQNAAVRLSNLSLRVARKVRTILLKRRALPVACCLITTQIIGDFDKFVLILADMYRQDNCNFSCMALNYSNFLSEKIKSIYEKFSERSSAFKDILMSLRALLVIIVMQDKHLTRGEFDNLMLLVKCINDNLQIQNEKCRSGNTFARIKVLLVALLLVSVCGRWVTIEHERREREQKEREEAEVLEQIQIMQQKRRNQDSRQKPGALKMHFKPVKLQSSSSVEDGSMLQDQPICNANLESLQAELNYQFCTCSEQLKHMLTSCHVSLCEASDRQYFPELYVLLLLESEQYDTIHILLEGAMSGFFCESEINKKTPKMDQNLENPVRNEGLIPKSGVRIGLSEMRKISIKTENTDKVGWIDKYRLAQTVQLLKPPRAHTWQAEMRQNNFAEKMQNFGLFGTSVECMYVAVKFGHLTDLHQEQGETSLNQLDVFEWILSASELLGMNGLLPDILSELAKSQARSPYQDSNQFFSDSGPTWTEPKRHKGSIDFGEKRVVRQYSSKPIAKTVSTIQVYHHVTAQDWLKLPTSIYTTSLLPISEILDKSECYSDLGPIRTQLFKAVLSVHYAAQYKMSVFNRGYPFPPCCSFDFHQIPLLGASWVAIRTYSRKILRYLLTAVNEICPDLLTPNVLLHDDFEHDLNRTEGCNFSRTKPFHKWVEDIREHDWICSTLEPARVLFAKNELKLGRTNAAIAIFKNLYSSTIDVLLKYGECILNELIPAACGIIIECSDKDLSYDQHLLMKFMNCAWFRFQSVYPYSHSAGILLAKSVLGLGPAKVSEIQAYRYATDPICLLRVSDLLFKSGPLSEMILELLGSSLTAVRCAAREAMHKYREQIRFRISSAPGTEKARSESVGNEEGSKIAMRSGSIEAAGPEGKGFVLVQMLIAARVLLVMASKPSITTDTLQVQVGQFINNLMVEAPVLFQLLIRHKAPELAVDLLMRRVPACASQGDTLINFIDSLAGEDRVYGIMVISKFVYYHRTSDTVKIANKAFHALAIICGVAPGGGGYITPMNAPLVVASLAHIRTLCKAVPEVIPTLMGIIKSAKNASAKVNKKTAEKIDGVLQKIMERQ